MLTFCNLRPLRQRSTLTRQQLATITGIDDQRIRLLELRQIEPWFDEAVLLSRVLCLTGINPLLQSGSLTETDTIVGPPSADDRSMWKSSARKPLSLACRIAALFGLPDPISLSVGALERQIWDVLSQNERSPLVDARFICPWCQADLFPSDDVLDPPHAPTCLPANLWAPHDHAAEIDPPLPQRRAARRAGIPAKGLKALRLARHLIQKEVAEIMGVHANHYSRLERGDVNLTLDHADVLARYYDVDREVLYAPPAGELMA